MATLVQRVRIQIRDTCPTQVFADVVDNTLATPAIVPNNSPELTQFIWDALGEYSRYRALRKPYTLDIVAGQTLYQLPSDWLSADLEAFNAAVRPGDVPDPMEYALPYVRVSAPLGSQQNTLEFSWYDDLQQVVLSTAPLADYSLAFAYYALHQPSTVPLQWLDVALAPACERALRAIATDQAVKLQHYKIAYGIEVDNRKIAEHLLNQADGWRERFRKEVVLRPYGCMGGDD